MFLFITSISSAWRFNFSDSNDYRSTYFSRNVLTRAIGFLEEQAIFIRPGIKGPYVFLWSQGQNIYNREIYRTTKDREFQIKCQIDEDYTNNVDGDFVIEIIFNNRRVNLNNLYLKLVPENIENGDMPIYDKFIGFKTPTGTRAVAGFLIGGVNGEEPRNYKVEIEERREEVDDYLPVKAF